jgi:CyaY protein
MNSQRKQAQFPKKDGYSRTRRINAAQPAIIAILKRVGLRVNVRGPFQLRLPKLVHCESTTESKVIDEVQFRKAADAAIEALKQELYAAEDGGDFEVEENAGALYVVFEEPAAKFVITPNAPVQQIWISALSTSFKLELSGGEFILPKTGENLSTLVKRLISDHLA